MNEPSTSFPGLVKDFPAKATKIICRLMNVEFDGSVNNWRQFATEVWQDYTEMDIRSRFEEKGKMEAILAKWGKKEATTSQLLQILTKIGREDVIAFVEEKYPSIR